MSMLRTRFSDLFKSRLPYLMAVFYEELSDPDSAFAGIFNIQSSSRFREQTTGLTGFGLPSVKPENTPIDYDDVEQAFDKTFEHVTYALGFQISKEAKADDIDGPLNDLTRALARSMRTGKARTVWNEFNLGFPAAATGQTGRTTPDGVSVFNASHTLIEGAAVSNLVSADLSISSLETAINLFADMVDHRGLEVELDPTMLLYPNELRWLVGEILGSALKPDTSDNATNVLNGILQPRQIRWLTDADSWFVMAPPGQNFLHLFNRQIVEFDADIDFDTKAAKESADERYSSGWGDWRGAVGGLGQ